MRGHRERSVSMFSFVSIKERIPASHPLRRIRKLADQVLDRLNPTFCQLYASEGGQSVQPEQLLPAVAGTGRQAQTPERAEGLKQEPVHEARSGLTESGAHVLQEKTPISDNLELPSGLNAAPIRVAVFGGPAQSLPEPAVHPPSDAAAPCPGPSVSRLGGPTSASSR